MTADAFKAFLESAGGVPVAYYQFLNAADEPPPPPPFMCWFVTDSDDLFADNVNYVGIYSVAVELYTEFKDFALEAQFEAAFKAAELAYEREETYLDDQRMHMTTWTMEILLNCAPVDGEDDTGGKPGENNEGG